MIVKKCVARGPSRTQDGKQAISSNTVLPEIFFAELCCKNLVHEPI
jgi:hypothetical protein